MKIRTTKKALFEALNETNKVIPIRTTLPILACVLLRAEKDTLKLTTTDLEQTIITQTKATIVEEGKTALPAGRFLEIIAALPEGEIEIKTTEKQEVELSSPYGVYKIIGKDPDEFPEQPKLQKEQTLFFKTQELQEIINTTTYAVSKDDLKPALCGIYLNIQKDKMTAVSTDGHRLVKYNKKTKTKNPEGALIIPAKFFTILKSSINNEGKLEVSASKNHLEVQNKKTRFITRIIKETFPDFNSVIPQKLEMQAEINKNQLLEAIKRVSIFSDRTTKQITLTFNNNEITITSEDKETRSSAKEHVVCEYNNEPLSVAYNAQYLKEVVQHTRGEKISIFLSGALTAAIFKPTKEEEGEETTTLLMPLRIQETQ